MTSSSPKPPKEDPAVGELRDRRIRDLAELDEETNRRIKTATASSRGTRAFRPRNRTGDRFPGSVESNETSSNVRRDATRRATRFLNRQPPGF